MKIGDLIRVCHFDYNLNGMIGILVRIGKGYGDLKVCYSVRIPSLTYEIGLSEQQCEVLHIRKSNMEKVCYEKNTM